MLMRMCKRRGVLGARKASVTLSRVPPCSFGLLCPCLEPAAAHPERCFSCREPRLGGVTPVRSCWWLRSGVGRMSAVGGVPWDVVQLAPCQRESRSPMGTALNSPRTGLRWHIKPQEKTLCGLGTPWVLLREEKVLRQVPPLWGRDTRLDSPRSALPDSAPPLKGLSLSGLLAVGFPHPAPEALETLTMLVACPVLAV